MDCKRSNNNLYHHFFAVRLIQVGNALQMLKLVLKLHKLHNFSTLFHFRYVQNFDVCILDDASECSELSSILPLQFNPTSVILFGDEKQESSDISSTGLNRSLFTRIIDGYKKFKKNCPNIHRLNEQFLMKNEICRALNTLFYDGRMETAKNVFDPEFKLNPYGFFDNSGVYFLIDLIKVVNEFLDSEQFSYRIIVPTHDDKKHLESILL